MNEILSKRVILLTNTLLVLCAIGFLALIHRVDASFKEKEYTTLNRLHNCITSLPEGIDQAENLDALYNDWLKANKKTVHDELFDLRVNLLREIDSAGFGKQIRSGKGLRNFRISLAFPVISDSIHPDFEPGTLRDNNKLRYFAQQYKYLDNPVLLKYATAYRSGDVKKAIEKRNAAYLAALKNIQQVDTTAHAHLLSNMILMQLVLDGDSCRFVFGISEQDQLDEDAVSIAIPVQTATLPMDKLHSLFGVGALYSKVGNGHEIQKLVNNYGEIPMDKALELVGEDYMEAYERMDVFGLSISTTSLPLVSLAFLIFMLAGIYTMLREARKANFRIISETENEDITDFFIKRKYMRFLIWVVIPLLSLGASMPHLQPEPAKLYTILAGTVVMLSLGLLSFSLSKKL
jgi:hypothetical protein